MNKKFEVKRTIFNSGNRSFFRNGKSDTLKQNDTQTLGNSALLNFEQALKIVKDAGCKVIRTKVIEEEL